MSENSIQSKPYGTRQPIPQIYVEKNAALSQWGRRLARHVGAKFGAEMVENQSKNEGNWRGKDIVIKCAKSPMPPVSVLVEMLDRLDFLWAVFIMPEGHADIWSVPVKALKDNGYFTSGEKVQKRVELHLKKAQVLGTKIGSLDSDEVDSCRIP
ncbi:MAG: hypothetical protein ABI210_04400 [Abditibacteriaceae bacterium]